MININIAERREKILKKLEDEGSVLIADLADSLNFSIMTIRRDLFQLEKDGIIIRFHGGAEISKGILYSTSLLNRRVSAIEEKKQIAKLASKLAAPGQIVGIDVGTTTYELARELTYNKLTVITPSPQIALKIADRENQRVYLTGGLIRQSVYSATGELCRDFINNFRMDIVFMSVGAINGDYVMTDYNADDVISKKAFIKNSKRVVLLVDSSKFKNKSGVVVGRIEEVSDLVTSDKVSPDILKDIDSLGVKIHICK